MKVDQVNQYTLSLLAYYPSWRLSVQGQTHYEMITKQLDLKLLAQDPPGFNVGGIVAMIVAYPGFNFGMRVGGIIHFGGGGHTFANSLRFGLETLQLYLKYNA